MERNDAEWDTLYPSPARGSVGLLLYLSSIQVVVLDFKC